MIDHITLSMGLIEDVVWFLRNVVTKNLQEVPIFVHRLILNKIQRGPLFYCSFIWADSSDSILADIHIKQKIHTDLPIHEPYLRGYSWEN